jgi:hypothetical protein
MEAGTRRVRRAGKTVVAALAIPRGTCGDPMRFLDRLREAPLSKRWVFTVWRARQVEERHVHSFLGCRAVQDNGVAKGRQGEEVQLPGDICTHHTSKMSADFLARPRASPSAGTKGARRRNILRRGLDETREVTTA